MKHPKPSQVQVIINPSPAHRTPRLAVLNKHFRAAGLRWDVSITHGAGDGRALAKQAIERGAGVVAAYGGDGTIAEVASGLVNTGIPLLILPGGTGNLVAAELNVGKTLEKACQLICGDEYHTRTIDVGRMGDSHFLLRIGCGIETGVLKDATRELKNQFGKWAYIFAAIRRLQEHPVADYTIRLNGRETFNAPGVACVVANAGTVGLGQLTLAPSVDIDDGKLDLFFLKNANIEGIVQLAGKMMGIDRGMDTTPDLDASHLVNHWQVTSVEISTTPKLDIQVDGDIVARTPQLIEVLPGALTVVVPAP